MSTKLRLIISPPANESTTRQVFPPKFEGFFKIKTNYLNSSTTKLKKSIWSSDEWSNICSNSMHDHMSLKTLVLMRRNLSGNSKLHKQQPDIFKRRFPAEWAFIWLGVLIIGCSINLFRTVNDYNPKNYSEVPLLISLPLEGPNPSFNTEESSGCFNDIKIKKIYYIPPSSPVKY